MSYGLKFEAQALKEWHSLDKGVRDALRKKLTNRLNHPHVPAEKLHGKLKDCYKIKHNKTGHRLIYQVHEQDVFVLVLAVGRREDFEAYVAAISRLNK